MTKKEIMIPEVSDTRHVGSKKDSIVLKKKLKIKQMSFCNVDFGLVILHQEGIFDHF